MNDPSLPSGPPLPSTRWLPSAIFEYRSSFVSWRSTSNAPFLHSAFSPPGIGFSAWF